MPLCRSASMSRSCTSLNTCCEPATTVVKKTTVCEDYPVHHVRSYSTVRLTRREHCYPSLFNRCSSLERPLCLPACSGSPLYCVGCSQDCSYRPNWCNCQKSYCTTCFEKRSCCRKETTTTTQHVEPSCCTSCHSDCVPSHAHNCCEKTFCDPCYERHSCCHPCEPEVKVVTSTTSHVPDVCCDPCVPYHSCRSSPDWCYNNCCDDVYHRDCFGRYHFYHDDDFCCQPSNFMTRRKTVTFM